MPGRVSHLCTPFFMLVRVGMKLRIFKAVKGIYGNDEMQCTLMISLVLTDRTGVHIQLMITIKPSIFQNGQSLVHSEIKCSIFPRLCLKLCIILKKILKTTFILPKPVAFIKYRTLIIFIVE